MKPRSRKVNGVVVGRRKLRRVVVLLGKGDGRIESALRCMVALKGVIASCFSTRYLKRFIHSTH